tara:strand:- start:171 stop:725 length:555 start_codon:yes stop_codon:yes gene_type:complete
MSAPVFQEAEEAPPECFICTESEPKPHRSACLCTDRYMHAECFLKMLNAQKGEPKCGVCGALYEDVGWRTKRVPQFISPCGFVLLLACTAIALTGCAINTAFAVPNLNKSHYGVIIVVSIIMFLGVMGALGCIAITIQRYGWRGVWASRYREEKVIVLGAARMPKRTTPAELELGELATNDVVE